MSVTFAAAFACFPAAAARDAADWEDTAPRGSAADWESAAAVGVLPAAAVGVLPAAAARDAADWEDAALSVRGLVGGEVLHDDRSGRRGASASKKKAGARALEDADY